MYREEYIKDTGGVPNRDLVICSKLRPLLTEPGDTGSTGNKFDDDSLFCDTPTGVLTARSRTCDSYGAVGAVCIFLYWTAMDAFTESSLKAPVLLLRLHVAISFPPNTTYSSISYNNNLNNITHNTGTRVPLTFQPAKAGLFDFILYCEVKAIVDGKEMMIPNEEAALLRVSQQDRETALSGTGPSSIDGLPLMAFVTTRATFPKISIMDARLESSNTLGE